MSYKDFQGSFLKAFFVLTILIGSLSVLAACSTNDKSPDIPDPMEDVNRVILKMNENTDKNVILPIAKGYRNVTPGFFRGAVRNFLTNLNSPVIIGNQLLQGDLTGAGNATARVIINTLAGFGGILDLAEMGGIEHEPEDFGQTLATWGVGDGMYIMLPLLGPSTLRDATGTLIDSYADPVRIYLFNIDEEPLHYTRVGVGLLAKREELIEVVDDLRRNSFDYYAAVRSAYYQHRQSLINDQESFVEEEIPDYDDF